MRSLLALASLFFCQTAHAGTVDRLLLDPDNAVEIAVGATTATTLQFPRPVRGIFGYGLTQGDASL